MSARKTGDAESEIREGNALFQRGDLEAAIARYQAALEAEKDSARAHYNLGVALERMERLEAAMAHYAACVEREPLFVKALLNWGNVLRKLGDVPRARELYTRVLSIEPEDWAALANLAGLAHEAGDSLAAEALYQRALAANEFQPEAHYRLGQLLFHRRSWREAARHFQRATELRPDFTNARVGWAHSLNEAGDREDARSVYEQVLEVDPGNAESLNNLASLALDTGRVADAREFLSRAAAARPELGQARYNLALLALREHDFERGWRDYDLRMQVDAATMGLAPTPVPQLTKGDLPFPGSVLVRKEQGLGDQILFSTLLPVLRESAAHVVMETDPRLLDAYRRSVPGVDFVRPEEAAAAIGGCDRQIPGGSLPALFRRSVRDFDAQPRALLTPDPARVDATQRRLRPGARIAVSWRSFHPQGTRLVSALKSATLESLASFDGAGVTLVDVQYGEVGDERRDFDARHPGLRQQPEWLDPRSDLEGLLAVIACCDLVVTTSNVTAHLAGALGKRAWLVYLGANPPFHYWSPRSDGHSLWYPCVEVVSDPAWKDWGVAFSYVAARWKREAGA